jgi:hypothetical protein
MALGLGELLLFTILLGLAIYFFVNRGTKKTK